MKNPWSLPMILLVQILFHLQHRHLNTEALAIPFQENRGSNRNPGLTNENKRHLEFLPEQDIPSDSELVGGVNAVFDGGISKNTKHLTPLQVSNNVATAEQNTVKKRIPYFENQNEAVFNNKNDLKGMDIFRDTRRMNPRILLEPEQRSITGEVFSNGNSIRPLLDPVQKTNNNLLNSNQVPLQKRQEDIDHSSRGNRQQPDNMEILDAPAESPDQMANLKRNVYPGMLKSQSEYPAENIYYSKFGDYENIQHETLSGKSKELQNVRRYQNGENFKSLEDESDGLERTLKYIQDEIREDVYGPKEWNSTRIILKNVRFPRNNNKVTDGTFYGPNSNGGMSMNGQLYSVDAYQRDRGIRKRNLGSNTGGSTTRAKRKSKHVLFITQDSSFGEDAETITNSASPVRKGGFRMHPVGGKKNESYATEMTQTLDEKQQPERNDTYEPDKNNKPGTTPNNDRSSSSTASHLSSSHGNSLDTVTPQLAANRSKNSSAFNGSNAVNAYAIGDVSHQIHDFGNMIKNNLSNIIKMNFDLGVPDNQFRLKVERKDLENRNEGFRSKKSNYKREPMRRFKPPRNLFHAKEGYVASSARRERHIRSLAKHSKNSPSLDQSNKVLSKLSEDNSKRAFSKTKEGGSKIKKPSTPSLVKFAYKILAHVPSTKPTRDSRGISTSKTGTSHQKRDGLNSTRVRFRPQPRTLELDPSRNQTNASEPGSGPESDHKRLVLRLVNDLSPEDSQALLKLVESNSSSLYNDSNVEFEGANAIYLLNISALENSSIPRDVRLLNVLRKSNLWDSVHYVEPRAVQDARTSHECCQDVLSVVKRNPFTVTLALAVLCVVIVVMLGSVFFMAERRFKKRKEFAFPAKKDSDYKVIKPKKTVAYGEVVDDPDVVQKPPEEATGEGSESEKGDTKPSPGRFHHRGWRNRETSSENKGSAREKQKLLPRKNPAKKKRGPKREAGFMNKARKWMRRKMSAVPLSDSEDESAETATEKERGSDSSSDTDETYVSTRRKLKKYVKTRGGRKKVPLQKPTRVVAPGLVLTLKEVQDHLTEDHVSVESLPAVHTELKQKIVTTGDCDQIDHMLVKDEWEKAFYTAHGLKKIQDDQDLTDYSPAERKKLDVVKLEKLSAMTPGGLGILSKGSSAHSLKSEIGKSINTAEWVNKHPKPVSNKILKTRYRK